MRAIWIFGPIVLLRIKTGASQNAIEEAGRDFVRNDRFHRRSTEKKFPPRVTGGKVDCVGRNFGLKDRRDRLPFAWQAAFYPAELRSVQRGKLHHRHFYVALVMDQFATQ